MVPHYKHLYLLFPKPLFHHFCVSPLSVTFPPPPYLFVSSDRDEFHYCSQSGPGGQLLCTSVHLNIILLIKGLPPPTPPLPLPCSRSCPFSSHNARLLFTQALTHSLHVKPCSCHLKRGDVTFVSTAFTCL